jgi:hypothetical protein
MIAKSEIDTLNVYSSKQVTDDGTKYLFDIEGLDLDHNTNITNKGLKPLKGIRYLTVCGVETLTSKENMYKKGLSYENKNRKIKFISDGSVMFGQRVN